MGCSACERRRRLLREKLAAKKAKGQAVQAVAIGAVLTVTEMAGKALGIHGEVEDERQEQEDPNDGLQL